MKSYIVYDGTGIERMTILAPSHNLAEVVAKKMFGENASVCWEIDLTYYGLKAREGDGEKTARLDKEIKLC